MVFQNCILILLQIDVDIIANYRVFFLQCACDLGENQLDLLMSVVILNENIILFRIRNAFILTYFSILNAAAFTRMLLDLPGDQSLFPCEGSEYSGRGN